MPKLKQKTHKGAQKRFGITGSGKLMRLKGHRTHIRRTKSAKVRRQFGATKLPVSAGDIRRFVRLLPNGID